MRSQVCRYSNYISQELSSFLFRAIVSLSLLHLFKCQENKLCDRASSWEQVLAFYVRLKDISITFLFVSYVPFVKCYFDEIHLYFYNYTNKFRKDSAKDLLIYNLLLLLVHRHSIKATLHVYWLQHVLNKSLVMN